MNADIVLAANHQWPKHGSKILFSLVAMLAGYSSQIYFQGVQFAPLPVSLIMCFSLSCLFTVPNLVILIFLQRILPCNITSLVEKCRISIQNFQEMQSALPLYFLIFYSSSQFMVIFQTFLTIPTLFSMPLDYVLSFSTSYFLQLCSLVSNLLALTSSVDETYDEIRNLRRELQLEILKSNNDERIKELEFWKYEVELLRPMNAAGYFNIDKTTLTSMLSVRYVYC